jgi:catechol 2,3-dioxygenase-like lactoylglutathione lyase family enzyme
LDEFYEEMSLKTGSIGEDKSRIQRRHKMIKGLHHGGITVANLERSIQFYGDILGLEFMFTHELSDEGLSKRLGMDIENVSLKAAFLRAGQDVIQLTEFSPKGGAKEVRLYNVGVGHLAFLVDNIEKTYEELCKKGVKFNAPPHTMEKGKMKGVKTCSAKDIDNILFEIMEPEE